MILLPIRFRFFCLTLTIMSLFFVAIANAKSTTEAHKERTRSEMRSAWYTWDPYQFERQLEKRGGEKVLTGLDIQLAKATLEKAGIALSHIHLEWADHQKALEKGTNDMAAGAFVNPVREKYAWFSNQYRYEPNVLYVKKRASRQYNFRSPEAMLTYFKKSGFRLGVVQGYSYALPIINDYVNNTKNRSLIIKAKNEVQNFKNLRQNKIDGFLVDRIVGATIAWRNGYQDDVEEYPHFFAKAPIHFMFSKKTVAKDTVEKINHAIEDMKHDGSYRKITKQYLFPILLNVTIGSQWFFILDIIGTIAFALSGVVIAIKEHYSIVGAFILALLPAVGGGAMRDVLVSRHPISIMRTPIYLLVVIGVVILGYVLTQCFKKWVVPRRKEKQKHVKKFPTLDRLSLQRLSALQVFDAIGLAAFTITGVTVSVEARLDPLWMWSPLLAAVTSSGGGILRDIVRSRKKIDALTGALYPEISVLWGVIFYFIIEWESGNPSMDEIVFSVLFVLAGTFLTRITAMLMGWRSLMY